MVFTMTWTWVLATIFGTRTSESEPSPKRWTQFEEAVGLLKVEEGMNFSLFQALGPEHPSPQIYILDFPSDLRAAFYLMLGGYYKPAILSLRNWLEMRLLGIYFGRVEHDRKNYHDWKQGKFMAPFGKSLVGRLFARADFRRADSQLGLRTRLETLYSELSAFTHGSGLEKHDLQRDTDNVPRYNRTSVGVWLGYLDRTFAEVAFWLFLAYDKGAYSALNGAEIDMLLGHLPTPYRIRMSAALGNKTP